MRDKEDLIHSARQSARFWKKHGSEIHSTLVNAWNLEAEKIESGKRSDYDEAALLRAYAKVEKATDREYRKKKVNL